MENYKIIKTDDGTSTVYSEEYTETMHTSAGAYDESIKKHVIPSGILQKEKEHLTILDVGFGLGYNVLACILELRKKSPQQKIKVISFEKQKEYNKIMESLIFNDERDKYYSIIKNAYSIGKYDSENLSLEIFFGDARSSILKMENAEFDAVFHDPYSPSKNPELWTVDFFKEMNKLMTSDAILTTYSSAFQIRRALIEAGFYVSKGPSTGKKKEGTLASKNKIVNSLSEDEIVELKNNIKSTPYCDKDLNLEREVIIENRIREMRMKKSKPDRPTHPK